MTTTNAPEYLIRASDNESALNLAKTFGLEEGTWLRVPLTVEDAEPNVYVRDYTDVAPEIGDFQKFSAEEKEKLTLRGRWNIRILLAADFWIASQYAANRSWWLHAWTWVSLPTIPDTVEYHLVALETGSDSDETTNQQ